MTDKFSTIHCRKDPRAGHPDILLATPQERGGQDQLFWDMFEKCLLPLSSSGTSGTRVNTPVITYPAESPGTGIQFWLHETYIGFRIYMSFPGRYRKGFR